MSLILLLLPFAMFLCIEPGSQPAGVVVSGAAVDATISFAANADPAPAAVQFNVTDDDISQEPVEVYLLSLSTITSGVSVGEDTEIRITSDDGKNSG